MAMMRNLRLLVAAVRRLLYRGRQPAPAFGRKSRAAF